MTSIASTPSRSSMLADCAAIERSIMSALLSALLHCPETRLRRSTELEQHAVAAARIAPFDVAARLADHPAGATFHATIDGDLHLARVAELVASSRAGLEQRKQCRRRNGVRAHLDVGAASINQVAIVEEL